MASVLPRRQRIQGGLLDIAALVAVALERDFGSANPAGTRRVSRWRRAARRSQSVDGHGAEGERGLFGQSTCARGGSIALVDAVFHTPATVADLGRELETTG